MDAPRDTAAAGTPAPDALESRYRTLFEQAPFSVQLVDLAGRTLQVNKAWEALWQVRDGDGLKEYVLNEYDMLADPQLHAKGVIPYLRRAFAGESVEVPAVLYDPAEIGKSGRPRLVTAQVHPIKDGTGRVCEVMIVHRDVTEQREAETALRTSELRLKQLANTIPQLAWIADANGRVQWYNDRWFDYTGTTAADMEGRGWQSVHDTKNLPVVLAMWKRSLAHGEPFQMTFPLRGRDGRFRPFFTLVAPLKDEHGNVLQWFGTNTDVSALQETQDELRQAEERLRLATEAGNIGIWDWDIENDVVTWSERVYPLHGLEPGSFGGRAADFVKLIHPEDREAMWRKVEHAMTSGTGFSADFRIVLPDGSPRWLSTWARMHGGQDGALTRMVGATISIDAYKKAEAALKESDRRKDEFLAMLAHELRNPLAPINTAAQLLKLAEHDPERVRRASEIIARQVKHMTEIVDDLLDVSRVTRGLVRLDRDPLDLKALASSAIEQVRPLLESRAHVLSTRMDAGPLHVLGDRTRLVQVIVNLLNNSAKYSPPGGEISLTIEAAEPDAVRVIVRDCGIGIDASLLPHVFELFTQATRTPDRSQGGLGIGLALVRSIVTMHGGRVDAHSDGPGKGSTFVVTLPLHARANAEDPASSQAPAPPRASSPLAVLIVDDNADAAQSLAALLESTGFEVGIEFDAHGALARSRSSSWDAYILDIGLPDVDGYELVRRLRGSPGSSAASFIALTGYGQSHDRERSRAAGFDHHLVKPVELDALVAVLNRLPRVASRAPNRRLPSS